MALTFFMVCDWSRAVLSKSFLSCWVTLSWPFGQRKQALGGIFPPPCTCWCFWLLWCPVQNIQKANRKTRELIAMLFHRSQGPSLVHLLPFRAFLFVFLYNVLNFKLYLVGGIQRSVSTPSFPRIGDLSDFIFKLNKCISKWVLKYIMETLKKEIIEYIL